jgi:hypothetical protein
MEMRRDHDGVTHEDAVQCSVRHVRDDIWFPATVQYRETRGGTVVKEENLQVDFLSFNEPIDPKVFEPASMNVPPETTVVRSPGDPRGALKWDGKAIVVVTEEEALARLGRPSPAGWPRRILFLGGSLAFALIAAGVFWWRYARRTPADVDGGNVQSTGG